ncbi:hypothetical protein TrRE_jg10774 [Triparma retinervis]|uniref:Uncharacterized protein n=1 Tax=Triparma retinervis TaxID=2557542 RepID=A0A9W7L5F5_9STRA|nr:hypothetical protein TrRE_jg10774 [Triparma retinervis]
MGDYITSGASWPIDNADPANGIWDTDGWASASVTDKDAAVLAFSRYSIVNNNLVDIMGSQGAVDSVYGALASKISIFSTSPPYITDTGSIPVPTNIFDMAAISEAMDRFTSANTTTNIMLCSSTDYVVQVHQAVNALYAMGGINLAAGVEVYTQEQALAWTTEEVVTNVHTVVEGGVLAAGGDATTATATADGAVADLEAFYASTTRSAVILGQANDLGKPGFVAQSELLASQGVMNNYCTNLAGACGVDLTGRPTDGTDLTPAEMRTIFRASVQYAGLSWPVDNTNADITVWTTASWDAATDADRDESIRVFSRYTAVNTELVTLYGSQAAADAAFGGDGSTEIPLANRIVAISSTPEVGGVPQNAFDAAAIRGGYATFSGETEITATEWAALTSTEQSKIAIDVYLNAYNAGLASIGGVPVTGFVDSTNDTDLEAVVQAFANIISPNTDSCVSQTNFTFCVAAEDRVHNEVEALYAYAIDTFVKTANSIDDATFAGLDETTQMTYRVQTFIVAGAVADADAYHAMDNHTKAIFTGKMGFIVGSELLASQGVMYGTCALLQASNPAYCSVDLTGRPTDGSDLTQAEFRTIFRNNLAVGGTWPADNTNVDTTSWTTASWDAATDAVRDESIRVFSRYNAVNTPTVEAASGDQAAADAAFGGDGSTELLLADRIVVISSAPEIDGVPQNAFDAAAIRGGYAIFSGETEITATEWAAMDFADQLNLTLDCSQCKVGKFASIPGTPSCQECSLGTYNKYKGMSSCEQCEAGKVLGASGTCLVCPEGKFSISGYLECQVFLALTFLFLPSVSVKIFSTFSCHDFDTGDSYLKVDYSLQCNAPKHKKLTLFALFMIALYPAGIPFSYFYLLYKNRRLLDGGSPMAALLNAIWSPGN